MYTCPIQSAGPDRRRGGGLPGVGAGCVGRGGRLRAFAVLELCFGPANSVRLPSFAFVPSVLEKKTWKKRISNLCAGR